MTSCYRNQTPPKLGYGQRDTSSPQFHFQFNFIQIASVIVTTRNGGGRDPLSTGRNLERDLQGRGHTGKYVMIKCMEVRGQGDRVSSRIGRGRARWRPTQQTVHSQNKPVFPSSCFLALRRCHYSSSPALPHFHMFPFIFVPNAFKKTYF